MRIYNLASGAALAVLLSATTVQSWRHGQAKAALAASRAAVAELENGLATIRERYAIERAAALRADRALQSSQRAAEEERTRAHDAQARLAVALADASPPVAACLAMPLPDDIRRGVLGLAEGDGGDGGGADDPAALSGVPR